MSKTLMWVAIIVIALTTKISIQVGSFRFEYSGLLDTIGKIFTH